MSDDGSIESTAAGAAGLDRGTCKGFPYTFAPVREARVTALATGGDIILRRNFCAGRSP